MQTELRQLVLNAVSDRFDQRPVVVLSRPDPQHGDYATNIALQLAKPLQKPPLEVAEMLRHELLSSGQDIVADAQVAGPGFINIRLRDSALLQALDETPPTPLAGKVIVTEFSDPNPFKPLHAGHLYTSVTGDAISNLLERAGATVHRVNFGGDVGLHVGRAMWGMINELGGELPDKLAVISVAEQPIKLGEWYVQGTAADEAGHQEEVAAYNRRVYRLHADDDHESPFARLYWTCRQWSYDYFDRFYARIGSRFEKYYPESQTAPIGLAAVRAHPELFTESKGALVFAAEAYGLHTRVFVTSKGLPTYETKDMGASLMKYADYNFDRQFIITGNDIVEYMKVVIKATSLVEPHIASATTHLTHGNVKLTGGVKMSSRHGNVALAVDVLDAAAAANLKLSGNDDDAVTLGAVKYAFLKQRIGGDIIYDPIESVSLEGNSGPYLQYAHARACSILRKAGHEDAASLAEAGLQPGERQLVHKLGEYQEVIIKATEETMPHHVCTYLYETAQEFNRFYEQHRVLGDAREALRLDLVRRYRDTLADGLSLLGITALERMARKNEAKEA